MELFNNDLKFYEARIYSNQSSKDNRLKVRILPIMDSDSGYNTDDLPAFPPLFKGTCLHGYSEETDGIEKAENVLVLSNNDFTFGWVICKSTCFNTNDSSESGRVPGQNVDFDYVKKNIDGVKFGNIVPDSDYKNLVVQTIVFENEDNIKGGMIEFYNYKSGDKYIFHSSGTGIAITAGGVKIFAGDQTVSGDDSTVNAGKCSYILLAPGNLSIKCQNISFEAKNISFGNGGRKIIGTTGTIPSYAEGLGLKPAADNDLTITF